MASNQSTPWFIGIVKNIQIVNQKFKHEKLSFFLR